MADCPPPPPPPPEIIPYGKRSHEGIPYGKPPPGRNPIAELPQGEIIPHGKNPPPPPGRNPIAELPQGEIIPYGKPSPSLTILPQHKFHMYYWDSMCDFFCGGGRNPIDGEILPYGILSGGKEIHGGEEIPCDRRPFCKNVLKKFRIDLKWPEMPSKVSFGHPKWPPAAIL